MKMSLIAVFTVLALVAAACGSGNEQAGPGAPAGSDQSSVLPPNSNPDDRPTVAGACIADEPDCEDTAVPGDDPSDLPPPWLSLRLGSQPAIAPKARGGLCYMAIIPRARTRRAGACLRVASHPVAFDVPAGQRRRQGLLMRLEAVRFQSRGVSAVRAV